MRRISAAVALLAALLAPARASRAEPSIWYRVSHPNARAEARLLRAIERMLDGEGQSGSDQQSATDFARGAVVMADFERLTRPEDPRLACAMAHALVAANLDREAQAETLLLAAIPNLPEGTLLVTAWRDLSRARALQGNLVGARDAATRVLELAVEPTESALAFYELARLELRSGEVSAAVADFQRAIGGAPTALVGLRARYGLGIALERSGDLAAAWGALEQAAAVRLPVSVYPSGDPLDIPGAFEPEYELDYVKALAALTRARRASDLDDRRDALADSLRHWDAYIERARPSEPWLVNARRFREQTARDLRKIHGRPSER